jgi:hypothetical protein
VRTRHTFNPCWRRGRRTMPPPRSLAPRRRGAASSSTSSCRASLGPTPHTRPSVRSLPSFAPADRRRRRVRARPVELVVIRLDDVDLDACRIRVTQGKADEDRDSPVLIALGKAITRQNEPYVASSDSGKITGTAVGALRAGLLRLISGPCQLAVMIQAGSANVRIGGLGSGLA